MQHKLVSFCTTTVSSLDSSWSQQESPYIQVPAGFLETGSTMGDADHTTLLYSVVVLKKEYTAKPFSHLALKTQDTLL